MSDDDEKFQQAQLGIELRDQAINATERANLPWTLRAFDAVRRLAETREEFTTDAVWHVLGDSSPPPDEPRAMGAVMRRAMNKFLVLPTQRTHQSVRPDCHRRPLRVWRSLVFRKQP
jgi:hypothetical protein